ncbi:GNAT family N-acetyltransferase [Streptomyces mirabilis]|uniref:GNAT family N-acetyltransferase n=1 Tax=Streptomyces mirabilis TaxID=68239 RepID=UPI0036A17423
MHGTWGGPTALAASGLGWAALHKDRVLAVACAYLLNSTHEDIACLTVPEHRREHLARACVTALCTDIAARGHTASWSCSRDNRPSRLLAWTTSSSGRSMRCPPGRPRRRGPTQRSARRRSQLISGRVVVRHRAAR